jgi:N6-L-threonylcarbamoyladenine synthase
MIELKKLIVDNCINCPNDYLFLQNVNNIYQSNKKIDKDKICEELIKSSMKALKEYGVNNLIIAGGVSANNYLRQEIKKITDKYNVELSVPRMKYCTDNAAMIGAAAYPLYMKREFADLTLNATSSDEIY